MQNNLFRTVSSISRTIIRSYARRAPNPGVQKRLNVLDEREDLNQEDIDLDELESDFMNVAEMHHEHERELKHYHEKEKYWIVRQKYFKEDKVNFLTWSDKEQIRHLHQSDPEEWSIEKLSEGFPALPETIKKILKSKWHIKNDTKRMNHDKAVQRNWKLFREGKISGTIPPDLRSHLMKFSTRKQESYINHDKVILNSPSVEEKPCKHTEFASIISSYESLKQKPKSNLNLNNEKVKLPETESLKSLGNSKIKSDNKLVTLNQFKKNISEKVEHGKPDEQELILNKLFLKTQNDALVNKNQNISGVIQEKDNSKHELIKIDTKKFEMGAYPERIVIPKDKFQKGKTYKVNDCYYDDDGQFLYRVPGMY